MEDLVKNESTETLRKNPQNGSTVCAWCEKVLTVGDPESPLSHGICLACMASSSVFPVENLESLTSEQLNRLPFGAVRIKVDGEIISYNETESSISSKKADEVIGKNFFHDVAPCTKVAEFQGKYLMMRRHAANAREQLKFIFKFEGGAMLVNVVLLYDAISDHGSILVQPIVQEER